MILTNPYIFGSPVKNKEMFFGRDDVFTFLTKHLVGTYQDNVIMLYGQRRTGKTSILYQILNNNRLGEGYVPVLISLEGLQDCETNSQIFLEIAQKIAYALNIEKPKAENLDAANNFV
jgi:AAA+ ATPase superfamily predicted ATPase